MKDIKLVIWDLDDTFWRGTLSEGYIEINPQNVEILSELTDRGIMNSIVSKNDYDKAMNALKDIIPDKWDYFIFPSINWMPKGKRVNDLLKQIKVLPENAIMIDDNKHNLEEIKFYNPKINCILPQELKKVISLQQFRGKDDKKHTRLKQYKNLEYREGEKNKYKSNEEFLQAADIKIIIREDVISQIDRVYELLHRTNQLNYTKQRITKDELMDLLMNDDIKSGYVRVSDKYGDYGICGFYAQDNDKLLHFLFSCRVLGMGIEQFIYAILGFPNIDIRGEVATQLNTFDIPEWITKCDNESIIKLDHMKKDKKVLLVGGCDLEQASIYLEENGIEAVTEFNTIIDGREYRSSDTCQILNAFYLDAAHKKELCERLPFYDERITFATDFFNDKYTTVIYSVVDDYIRGIYKSKRQDLYVGYAGFFDQDQWLEKYPREEFEWLFDNFNYMGREPLALFEKNLRQIADLTINKLLVLINGPDIDVSDLIGEDRVRRNLEMNAIVDKVVSDYQNLRLLDMRLIIQDRNDVIGDNRHFKRHVYYKMSNELLKIMEDYNIR